MSKGRIIAIANQKGGVGKTALTINLGLGLAQKGKRVLLIDADPQGDLTTSLGWTEPDNLPGTLTFHMEKIIREEFTEPDKGILHHKEKVDLVPSNIELSGMEVALVNVIGREFVLRSYLCKLRETYDYILIDTMPSLGMLTINAFAAADSVIIPVQAHYLSLKGMTQLVKTINKVQCQINPQLKIDGVVLTLADMRTNIAKTTARDLKNNYGQRIHVYQSIIPASVKAAEASIAGVSIYSYDRNGTAADAYRNLIREVLQDGGK